MPEEDNLTHRDEGESNAQSQSDASEAKSADSSQKEIETLAQTRARLAADEKTLEHKLTNISIQDAINEEVQAPKTVEAGVGSQAETSMTGSERTKVVMKTSVVGVIGNVALTIFKAFVGFATNSIAIVLDAVNNLTDAVSSLVTIGGTKLAERAPDAGHPFGHGRFEYLAQLIISGIIAGAGIVSMYQSIVRIIWPEEPDYDMVSLIIVAAAIIVKIFLGRYMRANGKRSGSEALVASGADSDMDAAISATTLVAAIIFLATGVSLEAWLGVIISVFIIKAGWDFLHSAIDQLLGERVDPHVAQEVKKTVESLPNVMGAYDLVLVDFGPQRLMGSIHIEVPDTLTASEIDDLERLVTRTVLQKNQVMIHTVGIYSTNVSDPDSKANRMRDRCYIIALSHKGVIGTHGFYLYPDEKRVSFDVVLEFGVDRDKLFSEILKEEKAAFPDYDMHIACDMDVSD